MKLSKKLVAAVLVMSMLLTVMPVFANESVTTTRTIHNTKVKLPADGSPVTLTNKSCGTSNGMSLVLDDASAEVLGIDMDALSNTITTSSNMEYAGILLSGAVYLSDWTYRPGATEADELNNKVIATQATYFEFEDIEVSHIRKSSGGALVLEISISEIREKATNVKMYGGDVDFSTLTEATVIEKIEKDIDGLNADNFVPYTSPYLVKNLTARAGENYYRGEEINLGSFPEDTKFFATSPQNLLYFGAEYGYTDEWQVTSNEYDMTFYTGSSNQFDENTSGPFNIVKPNFSGEYYVYGLRKDCSNGGPRLARFNISGQKFEFKDLSMVTWKSTDSEWSSKTAFFWDKGAGTVTFEEGKPYFFQNSGEGSSRLVAVAFVPVNAADFDAPAAIVKEDSLKSTTILETFTKEDFVIDQVETYTVKVDGEDFTAKPYYYQVHTAGETGVFDYEQNVFGEPVKYATVAEVVALTKGVTVAEATENYQIVLNGVREYAPEKMLAMPGDEIVIGVDAMTEDNFNPINLQGKLFRFINLSGTILRAGIHKNYVPSYLYDFTTKPEAATAPFTKAKFAGYLVWGAEDEYKGQKVYFESVSPNNSCTVAGDGEAIYSHFDSYSSSTLATLVIETPEGSKTVLNPYKVKASADKITPGSTELLDNFNTANLYWVNSTVNNDVRVMDVNSKKVIRTDGCKLIYVIIKKADGSFKIDRADLTPKDMYVVDLNAGETAYVWSDTPWNGTNMIPVCEPIVAQ